MIGVKMISAHPYGDVVPVAGAAVLHLKCGSRKLGIIGLSVMERPETPIVADVTCDGTTARYLKVGSRFKVADLPPYDARPTPERPSYAYNFGLDFDVAAAEFEVAERFRYRYTSGVVMGWVIECKPVAG